MHESATEATSTVLWVLMYFGGLLIWPMQVCIRRRWDTRTKALGVVCGIHVVMLVLLAVITDAWLGGDAHHAWWLFVLLNMCSCFVSLMAWLVTSLNNGQRPTNRAV